MKRLILFLSFFFIFLLVKSQGWIQVPGYQTSYNDVLGVTNYEGDLWVLTKNGIYKVVGSTWQLTSSTFTVNSSSGCMYTDGTDLYAGGLFYSGIVPLVIVKWDGSQWTPFAYSNNSGAGPVVTILKTMTGNLFAGGFFSNIGTQSTISNFPYFAMFDGSTWTQPFSVATTGCSFGVESIEKIGDSIYVAGGFYEINGIWTPGTFRFKEGGNMSTLDGYGFCATARDYQIYQNDLYAGGTRSSENTNVPLGLVKRAGNSWISVSEQIQITKTKIVKLLGKLYVAGKATGSPINGFTPLVISYDGVNVVNEGAGISSPPIPSSFIPEAFGIFADTIFNYLYVFGNFQRQYGNVADNFAVRAIFPLPVHLSSFNAKLIPDKKVLINWRDETPEDGVVFDVQVSTDGRNFSSAGQSYGQAGKKDYSFVYPYKECGKLYFRLAFEGKYSEVKVVTIPCDISIVAYDKTLRIQNKASGTLTIINSSGQTLARTVLANGQSEISVDLVSGVYIANFVDKNGMVFNQKFLIK